jgi:hypothetical protein
MIAKDVAVPVPSALPGVLGVRVRPDQDNPLGLALADDRYPPGIRASDAEREINRLFVELELPLRFRRVSFLEIAFQLWEDVLDAALAKGVVVGLGVDFGVLMERPTPRSAQHVLRVLAHNGEYLEVPDGFWMVGAEQDLHLPFTLPWGASQ